MQKIINEKLIIDKCQIFTPDEYAHKLLDYAEYKKNLYGKKILENSCGDGQILKIIVERYIVDSLKNNLDIKKIRKGLEKDIYGIEIDKIHFNNCLNNLNLIAEKYNLKDVKWNIFNENSLGKKWKFKFDFIVGNPPYISYRDLNTNIKNFLRNKYISCEKGRFDYCYAFIEDGINNLSNNGKFAYIIPNSIFKNVFGQNLRDLLLQKVIKIIDFKSKRLFKNALTTTAFLICSNNNDSEYIEYLNNEDNENFNISKETLKNKKWIFSKKDEANKLNLKKFGDYFHAAMGVATLHNKTFVIKEIISEDEEYIYINNYKIEKSILKKGASPSGLKNNKKEYIIFPYQYIENQLKKITEEEMNELFPEALRYLKSQKDILLKRSLDGATKWFEYGKIQALHHINTEKLLLSSLITSRLKSYFLTENDVPYSGIYIKRKGELPLERAKEILESTEFFEYVKKIGKNANGTTIKITTKDINNYYF